MSAASGGQALHRHTAAPPRAGSCWPTMPFTGMGPCRRLPLRARADIQNKMQHQPSVDASGVLPGPLGAELRAMLAPDENVQAAFEVDLTPELRFAPGLLVLTEGRLLARGDGTAMQQWPLAPGMALRDYFAAKAMQQLVISVFKQEHVDGIVSASYIIADAMLKARES